MEDSKHKLNIRQKKYLNIIERCESLLEKHGDTNLGVGWPKKEDVDKRYKVMLEVIREKLPNIRLLDLGCGASHFYEFILRNNIDYIKYSGLDLSEKYLNISRNKFPQIDYYCLDVLDNDASLPDFDYIIMNGLFTSKCELSFDEMFAYFNEIVPKVFAKAQKGIAFNVMSKHVDWERNDLFHLPFDLLATFLTGSVSRHFVFRNDYGLYEYTTYVYKTSNF